MIEPKDWFGAKGSEWKYFFTYWLKPPVSIFTDWNRTKRKVNFSSRKFANFREFMPGKYNKSPGKCVSHPFLPGEFENFLLLRASNSWRGIWRWGNSQKTSHFPGRNTNSLAGNTISLAGSSYIFEGMFPLNIFFFYLIDSWAGKKQKIYPQKHACVYNYICVYSTEIVFD